MVWLLMKKNLTAFFLPGGAVFLAAIGFLRPHGLPDWIQTPVSVLPFIVLMFGVVFGWYFASSRLILSLLVLAMTGYALLVFPPTDLDPTAIGRIVLAGTTFLLPLNLLALSLIKEDAITTWRSIVRFSLILAQPFVILWLCLPEQADLAQAVQHPLHPFIATTWTMLPQAALLAFTGTLVLLFIRFTLRRDPLDGGTVWALMTVFVAFQGIQHGWSPMNFLSAAGLTLFLTLVQASYQRTYRDGLTGVLGKLAFEEAAIALGRQYVIAVVGIDQLKHYGSQHGKTVGEQLLCLVAPKIVAAAGSGTVFRLAGEEFTILFVGKTATETLVFLEAIRKSIEQSALFLRGRERVWEDTSSSRRTSRDGALTITVSIGLAESGGSHLSHSLVTKAAYRALYEAKGEGGNLVKRGTITTGIPKRALTNVGMIVPSNEFSG